MEPNEEATAKWSCYIALKGDISCTMHGDLVIETTENRKIRDRERLMEREYSTDLKATTISVL